MWDLFPELNWIKIIYFELRPFLFNLLSKLFCQGCTNLLICYWINIFFKNYTFLKSQYTLEKRIMDYMCTVQWNCMINDKSVQKHLILTTSDAFQSGVTANHLNRCQRLITSSLAKPKFIVFLQFSQESRYTGINNPSRSRIGQPKLNSLTHLAYFTLLT